MRHFYPLECEQSDADIESHNQTQQMAQLIKDEQVWGTLKRFK